MPEQFNKLLRVGIPGLCMCLFTIITDNELAAQTMLSTTKPANQQGLPGSGLNPLQIQAIVQASLQVTVSEYLNPLASLEPGNATRMAIVKTDARIPYRIIPPDGGTLWPCQPGIDADLSENASGLKGYSAERFNRSYNLKTQTDREHLPDNEIAVLKRNPGGDSSAVGFVKDRVCLQSVIHQKHQALLLLLTAI